MLRVPFAVGLFLLVTGVIPGSSTPIFVAASIGDPCTQNWRPRDPTNEFNCTLQELQPWLIHNGIAWAMPLIITLLFSLVIIPCLCFGRYCLDICGSHKPRPGHCCYGGALFDRRPDYETNSYYSAFDIRASKFFMVLLFVFGLLTTVVSIVGALQLLKGFTNVLSSIQDAAEWILMMGKEVRNILSGGDPSTTPPPTMTTTNLTLPSEFSDFGYAQDNATATVNRWRNLAANNHYVQFLHDGLSGLGYITILPLLMFLMGVIVAYRHWKYGWPFGLIVVTCFVAPVFGACGTVGVVSNAAMGMLKSEVDAQSMRSAGVFQDYVYPKCVENNPISIMSSNINATARTLTTEGCQLLTSVCSTSIVYDSAYPMRTFYCQQDPVASCNTVDDLINLATRAVPKSGGGNPETCGTNCSFLLDCPTACVLWENRNASSRLGRGVTLQTRAATAYDTVLAPYADCNVLIDHILSYLPLRGALPLGLQMLTAAFCVTIILLFLFTVGLFRGQKRFFEPKMYMVGGKSHHDRSEVFDDSRALNQIDMSSKHALMDEIT